MNKDTQLLGANSNLLKTGQIKGDKESNVNSKHLGKKVCLIGFTFKQKHTESSQTSSLKFNEPCQLCQPVQDQGFTSRIHRNDTREQEIRQYFPTRNKGQGGFLNQAAGSYPPLRESCLTRSLFKFSPLLYLLSSKA